MKSTKIKYLFAITVILLTLAFFIPIKSYTHSSCGDQELTTRFNVITGGLKDYNDLKDLISGAPLCATDDISPRTIKLYLL